MSLDPALKDRIARAVEDGFAAQVAHTQDLVRFASTRGNEHALQDHVFRTYRARGLAMDRFEMDHASIAAHPGGSKISATHSSAPIVVGIHRPRDERGRSLILQAHVDVVPPGPADMWTHPPFEPVIDGDWLYGRGGADMKAGHAANLFALDALRAIGSQPAATLTMQSVVEEESTGNGALAAHLRGYRADAVLIPEPQGETLVRANVGVLWFNVEVRGRPTHVREMGAGANAIDAAYRVVGALRELEAAWNARKADHPTFADEPHPINLNIGRISGGDWASSVPAWCRLECRISLYPGVRAADAAHEIEQAIAAFARSDPLLTNDPPRVTFDGFFAEGYELEHGSEAEAVLARAHEAAAGAPLRSAVSLAYLDTRVYALYDRIPALCYGPISENIHGFDERVSLASLKRVTIAMAFFIAEWCGLAPAAARRPEPSISSQRIGLMSLPNSPSARDVKYHLHPVTDARRLEETGPIIIERGDGIYVVDSDGRRLIEGLSGLWNAAVGFGEPRLAAAASRQLAELPYYHTFSSKSNLRAIELAERLVAMTPARLTHVFFANSGSEANDTVVKLVWYYNNAIGRPRKKTFVARTKAYHGVTVASGSLTGLPVNHRDFDLPAIPVRHLTCPHFYRFGREGESEAAFVDRLAAELEALIEAEGAETIAAFIGEPLMGAGGVIAPPAGYWERMQAICRRHDILVVADEVITGFGRLGTLFGSDYYGIEPDLMVVSKQLTSGYIPLAAVLMTDPLYEAIADNTHRISTFGHGFTTSGNPVACAVALENLAIIEERGLVANARAQGELMHRLLSSRLAGHPSVGEIRGAGLIAGVELVADKATRRPLDPAGKLGAEVFTRAHEHGLIVRAIGDTIALCPPLIITADQVEDMVAHLAATLADVAGAA